MVSSFAVVVLYTEKDVYKKWDSNDDFKGGKASVFLHAA
jgi:hypothetical protein